MMHRLKLQTTVHPIQPCRTVDIHRGPELPLREALSIPQVRGRHAPMTQRDLHV